VVSFALALVENISKGTGDQVQEIFDDEPEELPVLVVAKSLCAAHHTQVDATTFVFEGMQLLPNELSL
jgi:hypothetical protein